MKVPAEIESLLREERVAHLATVDRRGMPHIVPIVFAWEGDRLYTPVDAKPKSVAPTRLRRVRNIVTNPSVQVLLDRYHEDWTQLWYVQVRGRAAVLEDGPAWERGKRLLEAKYQQYQALPLEGYPIIAIEIEGVVTWGWAGELRDED